MFLCVSSFNSCSFKQNYTYEKFISKIAETGTSLNLSSQCIKQNELGSGANSIVYKFTDEKLKNWAIKVITKYNDFRESFLEPITRMFDEFGNINLGQGIAQVGKRITILKRIDGTGHSVQDWSARRRDKKGLTEEEVIKFNNDLKKISDFNQEVFNNYAQKLVILNEKGYKADSFNPNNYLINYDTNEIHIIDAYKYEPDMNQNSKYDLICPLLDYPNFEEYYNKTPEDKKQELIKSARIIFEKCTKAAELTGLETSEEVFTNFIAKIDSRENNGNMYSSCFKKLKEILLL